MGQAPSSTSVTSPAIPTDCPPVSFTDATVYDVTTVTQYTATATSYITEYAGTVEAPTTTINITSTTFAPTYTTTMTFTDTRASIVIEQVPFTTTITVPTSSGFTPVLCEATYQSPDFSLNTVTLASTSTIYTPMIITSAVRVTYLYRSYPYTVQSTITTTISFIGTSFAAVVATSTSTRTNPTATVYEACNYANVVDTVPDGNGYLRNVNQVGANYNPPYNIPTVVYAVDQTDCCAQCQADLSCAGSAYYPGGVPTFSGSVYLQTCQLYSFNNNTQQCDPSFSNAVFNATSAASSPFVYISNSGCGSIDYDNTPMLVST